VINKERKRIANREVKLDKFPISEGNEVRRLELKDLQLHNILIIEKKLMMTKTRKKRRRKCKQR